MDNYHWQNLLKEQRVIHRLYDFCRVIHRLYDFYSVIHRLYDIINQYLNVSFFTCQTAMHF